MKVIQQSVEWNGQPDNPRDLYRRIEAAGRVCYQSETKPGDTPEDFIQRTLAKGHEAVIEHGSLSMKMVTDRGVTHEIVRHRLFSFCQESTRYCNYSQKKFGNQITVIDPTVELRSLLTKDEDFNKALSLWRQAMVDAESKYLSMLNSGVSPQMARSVLPNSTKTTIVVSGNIREWRHFFWLRKFGGAGTPHPQMRTLADLAWTKAYRWYPVLFEDLLERASERGLPV